MGWNTWLWPRSCAHAVSVAYVFLALANICTCGGRPAQPKATPAACSYQSSTRTPIQNNDDSSAEASSVPKTLPTRKPGSRNDILTYDFSFSHIGPGGYLPYLHCGHFHENRHPSAAAPVEQAGLARHEADSAAPRPVAVSLRECSLGDAGVGVIARSPWVFGEMGARTLSLRHNQVCAHLAQTLPLMILAHK